jgi:type I restriction enzyme, S subunit
LSMDNLITDHIETWTTAKVQKASGGRGRSKKSNGRSQYGIKKLRELILDLAVRGKLVPQDPNDEPASVLLEKIADEKARLVKGGKIRKQKPLPEISEVEKPFKLPASWEFVRLSNIATPLAGFAFKSAMFNERGDGLPLIRIRDVGQPFSGTFYSGEFNQDYLVENGDYLISMDGNFRVAPWSNREALLNQRVTKLIFIDATMPKRFVADSLQIRLLELQGVKAYTTVDHLSSKQIASAVIGLAPAREQHRIVAKVDELMTLCDLLEQEQTDNSETHQLLVKTLLDTLTNTTDHADFIASWQRIEDNFDILFTTSGSIDELKKTILQLAVMGKLVSQDPNDEPANILLEKIAEEKARLVREKIYQKTGQIKPYDLRFSLPPNWVGVRIGEICPSIVPNRDKPKSFTGNIPWVTLPDFPIDGWSLDVNSGGFGLTPQEVVRYSARLIPAGSVMMSCVGRFGLTAISRVSVVANQQIHAFIVLAGMSPVFLSTVIRANAKALDDSSNSTTIKYLNKTKCESIQFGLPPLNEQHRIVAKVDELMAVCDSLIERLNDAQTTQVQLADGIVGQAID